ncbi:MAG: hypothetical protein AB8G95_24390 [Anaerolineae bacterium]
MSQLPTKLVAASAGLFFFFLIAGGMVTFTVLAGGKKHDYPNGIVITGQDRCGTNTWLQRGRSIRLERYRCVLTEDSDNEVFIWYIRNGYTPLNGGLALKNINQGIIPVIELERIYLINQKDGTTMVRIYDDTTVRAP